MLHCRCVTQMRERKMEKSYLEKSDISKKTFIDQMVTSFKKVLRITRDEPDSVLNLQVSTRELSDSSLNLQAYILAKQRMLEIETQKAMSVLIGRHEKWKAGGPL